MGHLINPYTYRLGISSNWRVIWNSFINYKVNYLNDSILHKFLNWFFITLNWIKYNFCVLNFILFKKFNFIFINVNFLRNNNRNILSEKFFSFKFNFFLYKFFINKKLLTSRLDKKIWFRLKNFLETSFFKFKFKKFLIKKKINKFKFFFYVFSLKFFFKNKFKFFFYKYLKNFKINKFFFIFKKKYEYKKKRQLIKYKKFFFFLKCFLYFFLKNFFFLKKTFLNFFRKNFFFDTALFLKKFSQIRVNVNNFRIAHLMKKITRILKQNKDFIGIKIGFFGRYEKKLRNKKVWLNFGLVAPSNINAPCSFSSFIILLKQGLCGIKITLLLRMFLNEIF